MAAPFTGTLPHLRSFNPAPRGAVTGAVASSFGSVEKRKTTKSFDLIVYGAGDEARTRYLHLGKVALYRMSYARMKLVPPVGIEPTTRGFSVRCSTY